MDRTIAETIALAVNGMVVAREMVNDAEREGDDEKHARWYAELLQNVADLKRVGVPVVGYREDTVADIERRARHHAETARKRRNAA